MDDALVYMIVIVVGMTAVGIGGLFALDYRRRLRGIEPPPPYVPRENEIDVFASFGRVSGSVALAIVLGVGYFSPVDGLAAFLLGVFLFMYAGLKLHAKTGVLTRSEVGLAVGKSLVFLTVSGSLISWVMFYSTGAPRLSWLCLTPLLAALVVWRIGGSFPSAAKLCMYATLLILGVVQPAVLAQDLTFMDLAASLGWQSRISLIALFVALASVVVTARTPKGANA